MEKGKQQQGDGQRGSLQGYYVKKIGQNRGIPRVWLEGSQATSAGFVQGTRFDITVEGRTMVLTANTDGSRTVSGKKVGERMNPVIDLNSKELLAIFDGMAAVRVVAKEGQIYLLPLASELKKQERFKRLREKLELGEPLTMGSLSHGGGILSHAIHSGLAAAGIESKLAFANEIRPELLEHAQLHNDAWGHDTIPYAAPMQELAFDDRGVATLPRVEILELGLPCSGASRAGRSKRGLEHAEAHPEVGHLVVSALLILSKTNPAIVIFENVPEYAQTGSADILRNQLRDMGYRTEERVLNGKEWGALENRNRWCMVATSHGIEFNFDQLMPPVAREQTLGDVLEPLAPDDPRWSRMQGLKDKEVRDLAEGKGFKMQVFSADAESIGTITKGYARVRSTDPKITHPTNPDLLRQLTPIEHARLKEVPEHLVDGLSNTLAHEVLGQGVVYRPFKDVGQHVGNALNRLAGREEIELDDRAPSGIEGGALVEALTAEMAGQVLTSLKLADSGQGHYLGSMVVADGGVLIQDAGRGVGIVHQLELLSEVPNLGASVEVCYARGIGTIKGRDEQVRNKSGRGIAA